MSSDKHCSVPGCRKSRGSGVTLHKFPNPEHDNDRFNTWIHAIGSDILGLENEHIYKYRRVCRSHFAEEYLCRNNKLSNVAIPTLNMPGLTSIIKDSFPQQKPMRKILSNLQPSTSRVPALVVFDENAGQVIGQENLDPTVNRDTTLNEVSDIFIETSVPMKKVPPHLDPTVNRDTTLNEVSDISIETSLPMKKVPPHLVSKKAPKKIFSFNQQEKVVHSQLVAAKRKINQLRKKVTRQSAEIKAAKKLASKPAVLDVLENCTSSAKLLMQIQFRENRKKDKGRRFSLQEKILALSILKQSPKAYNFFRKFFILPAAQTLVKLVQRCNLKPGINKNIFSQLKEKAQKLNTKEKLCVLLYDEISLKAHVSYSEKKDKVTGFVDDGFSRQQELADHAQVFMVRGLVKNYKQAVAYSFSASATKGPALAKQIKDVVTELQNSGMIVLATVCDQGANNRHAIKILLNETRGFYLRKGETPIENVILINGQEIIPLYDPPHLLKGIRNNIMTKDLKFMIDGEAKIAKWSHIEMLHKENPGYKGIKMIPKLTERHVNKEKMNKMKVKYASQIFSRTVASNMGYLADKSILPEECKDTADF